MCVCRNKPQILLLTLHLFLSFRSDGYQWVLLQRTLAQQMPSQCEATGHLNCWPRVKPRSRPPTAKESDLQRTMPFKHGKTFAALTPSRRNPSKISCRINCVLLTVDICRSWMFCFAISRYISCFCAFLQRPSPSDLTEVRGRRPFPKCLWPTAANARQSVAKTYKTSLCGNVFCGLPATWAVSFLGRPVSPQVSWPPGGRMDMKMKAHLEFKKMVIKWK